MYAMNYDDLMRKMRDRGVKFTHLATVFENTPEFDAWWRVYTGSNAHQNMHLCTEDDNRTHTFYMIGTKGVVTNGN